MCVYAETGVKHRSFGYIFMKILVIDDDADLRATLVIILNELGYEADAVGSAEQAVKTIEQNVYDFIFLDFKMPERDGSWFMKHAEIPNTTKVLLMTAYLNRVMLNDMFKLGIRGYLIKPIEMDEIQKHIEFHSM